MEFRLARLEDLKQLKIIYKEIIKNMNKNNIKIWDDIYPCKFFEIGKVHQIYTDVTSDDIARYVRQILAEDEYHRMKPTEVAKEVVAIITGSPTRKKRRPSSKAPASKNICDYISNT